MAIFHGILHDRLRRSPLVQLKQSFQQIIQASVSSLLLNPNVQQLVDPVFIEKVLSAFDHIVTDPKLTEESLMLVHIQFFKIPKASLE